MRLFRKRERLEEPKPTHSVVYVVSTTPKRPWMDPTTRLYFELRLESGQAFRTAVVMRTRLDALALKPQQAIRTYGHRVAITWANITAVTVFDRERMLVEALQAVLGCELIPTHVTSKRMAEIIEQRKLYEATHPREPKLEWTSTHNIVS